MGTADGLLRANSIQEILQLQEDFHRNTKRVLQDIENITRRPAKEDAANIVTKEELQECVKCANKVQEDITSTCKILATNQNKKKDSKSRKHC